MIQPMEPKVAIVCDWLTDRGGAERVILALHKLYPEAPIYTSIYNPTNFPELKNADVKTSFIQKFPGAKRHHQWYISLMPSAFESFDLSRYNIVISSSHACAKGIITKPETLHVSYCHSPPRYLWDNSHDYVENYPLPKWMKRTLIPLFLHRLRLWDRAAAERVDRYVVNSEYVKNRVQKYYRKKSEVIHPPVAMGEMKLRVRREPYFLAVGRLIPYKRFDLIVETFNELKLPLKIVGQGNQFSKLKKMAFENIEFLGTVSDETLTELYQNAQALIFPQVEDFGIIPPEAMAQGCPVIAYAEGGALETIKEKVSGLFFHEQTVEALKQAILEFQKMKFDPEKVRKQAEKFSSDVFANKIDEFVAQEWEKWK